MSDVDVDAGVLVKFFVVSHLRPLVESHRPPQLAVEAVEDRGTGLGDDVARLPVSLNIRGRFGLTY